MYGCSLPPFGRPDGMADQAQQERDARQVASAT